MLYLYFQSGQITRPPFRKRSKQEATRLRLLINVLHRGTARSAFLIIHATLDIWKTKSGWRQSTVRSSGCLTLSFFKLFSHEFSVWALLHWALDWKVEEDKGVVDKLVGKQIFWIEMNISPHVGRSWLMFVVTYSLKQSNLDSFCGHRERSWLKKKDLTDVTSFSISCRIFSQLLYATIRITWDRRRGKVEINHYSINSNVPKAHYNDEKCRWCHIFERKTEWKRWKY